MDIESLGFVIGLIGAVILKSSMNLMNDQPTRGPLRESMGREPENLALKTFLAWIDPRAAWTWIGDLRAIVSIIARTQISSEI